MTSFTVADHTYMTLALRLAEQGLYSTQPNPRVGCVIVKNNQIIGQGAHLKAGEPHAEVFALREAGASAKEADAYVTLEPCNHQGRTPPCVDALIIAGIKRVVVAMQDPNPLVAGKGIQRLQAHGIEVKLGLMEAEANALNPGFISRMTRGLPYVRSKVAASLDGSTALNNGQSQWITSDAARQDVQHWRAQSCAILTGIGSVLADNPSMNVRLPDLLRQPLRVVVDSKLQIPLDAKILQGGNTLIAYANGLQHRSNGLQAAGASLLQVAGDEGKVCLKSLLSHLASLGINEVMVEAGGRLNGALLAQNLIDELLIYYAPKLMGSQSKGMFALPTLIDMRQAINLQLLDIRQIGKDIRLRAKPIQTAD